MAAVNWSSAVCHAEALQLLVGTVFPSASIAFAAANQLQMPVGRAMTDDALFAQLHEKLRQAETSSHLAKEYYNEQKLLVNKFPVSLHSAYLQARNGPTSTSCSSELADVWSRLYRRWPPQLVAGRQLWRYDSEDSSLPRMPCWTPHAVVYVGGFEAPDLRRVVAPQVFAQVPPFSSDTKVRQTVGGKTFNYQRQKVPKFASRVLDGAFLLREKGCAIHDPDLLEIALPVDFTCGRASATSCPSKTRRVRTFISFAGDEPNLRALQVEVDPLQRRALRPAFGYSMAALKFALPPPLISATRLLREWNASWSSTPLSAAFWFSAVGHAVERRLPNDAARMRLLFDANDCGLVEASKSLAFLTASLVSSSPQECWSNFFLPVERLEAERGVRELMDTVNLLPVAQLQ
ncbi:hypothetical protein TraAM80_03697 [Trypanosoma rangeli]|uniref:Uncharacterized protein n=1 Tax=Trypanosoma rangeli TaxID=5698 RepID=A0A3R7KFH1_TRYRA|nr:uncharacterized protein TraAM80_03697 [Trypanosoma rangeli]RNF06776.1 hypothetical protein TraAM80_03697 [Trypanosoma rangeli]|eukprot:RNF06776.1 hypothetical protein TraAM80_03697 [Trypanosoma rangeli]